MNYDQLKQTIYHLECSHLKPNVRVSTEELSTILADDYFEFGSSGHIWKRSDYAGDHPLSPDRFVISNFDIHVLAPDCVLATYHILKPSAPFVAPSGEIEMVRGNCFFTKEPKRTNHHLPKCKWWFISIV